MIPKALLAAGTNPTTILGYGALLSEESARLTFPQLSNFRLVRTRGLRRIFSHPHLFLINQEIVDPSKTLRLASLSAEFINDDTPNSTTDGFVVAAFDVNLNDDQRIAFVEREPEYSMEIVPFYELSSKEEEEETDPVGHGVICVACKDDNNLPPSLDPPRERLTALGLSVWNWEYKSGLLPADVYLRHCLLAVKKAGPMAEQSFLDETFLVDRTTTLGQYLSLEGNEKSMMNSRPPKKLEKRFNG